MFLTRTHAHTHTVILRAKGPNTVVVRRVVKRGMKRERERQTDRQTEREREREGGREGRRERETLSDEPEAR